MTGNKTVKISARSVLVIFIIYYQYLTAFLAARLVQRITSGSSRLAELDLKILCHRSTGVAQPPHSFCTCSPQKPVNKTVGPEPAPLGTACRITMGSLYRECP